MGMDERLIDAVSESIAYTVMWLQAYDIFRR